VSVALQGFKREKNPTNVKRLRNTKAKKRKKLSEDGNSVPSKTYAREPCRTTPPLLADACLAIKDALMRILMLTLRAY